MRLNPTKFSFVVQPRKFLGFMLTRRGIEATPDKCAAILNMKSSSNPKEVQQLTGRLATLSHFLSCAGDHGFHFFVTLRKGGRVEWTQQCEDAFSELKQFLANLPILAGPRLGHPLLLHLAVSDNALGSVLAHDVTPVFFSY